MPPKAKYGAKKTFGMYVFRLKRKETKNFCQENSKLFKL